MRIRVEVDKWATSANTYMKFRYQNVPFAVVVVLFFVSFSICCANCHSRAAIIALSTVSCAKLILFSKIGRLREFQICQHIQGNSGHQHIQGNSGPLPIPVGGKQVIIFPAISPEAKSEIVDRSTASLNGLSSQTLLAKAQWKKRWEVVSLSPHLQYVDPILIPRTFCKILANSQSSVDNFPRQDFQFWRDYQNVT